MTTSEAAKKLPASWIWVRKWCQKNMTLTKQGPISAYDISEFHLEKMRSELKPAGRPKLAAGIRQNKDGKDHDSIN